MVEATEGLTNLIFKFQVLQDWQQHGANKDHVQTRESRPKAS